MAAARLDHERIVLLADGGHVGEAIDKLTGIGRGDAAFDFYHFDAAVSELAAGRRQAFDAAMADARAALSGWPLVPALLIGTVVLLALLGMRPRLAEYR